MAALCGRARRIDERSEEIERLRALYPVVKRIKGPAVFLKPVTSFGSDISDALTMYLKVFLLGELSNYLKAAGIIRGKGEELRSLYETVGFLDAYCARSELIEEEEAHRPASIAAGSRKIVAMNAVHPLVEGCVPVSFSFARGVILTGTNMSGKSTFLRTLGINQILATNLGMAYADTFETDLFFVSSSIRSEDNRASGESRYLAEAERLLSIIRSIEAADPPILALIDEILNATNSQDRIAASIAILRGAAGQGSIAVAASHDLEIAEALHSEYSPYYFSERIEEGKLVFDYALRDGIVDRKNALPLLRLIGFSDNILGRDYTHVIAD
jgi:DNA mismatch repair ATPase MutS